MIRRLQSDLDQTAQTVAQLLENNKSVSENLTKTFAGSANHLAGNAISFVTEALEDLETAKALIEEMKDNLDVAASEIAED